MKSLKPAPILTPILALIPALAGLAQTPADSNAVPASDYTVKQSFEFGGRTLGRAGNAAVYETFVNLVSGPRLLEQSLDIQSRSGKLFDNVSLSGFGFGGDPNTVARFRADRNRWYNFSGQFRRDRNFWDYNLLANPLNPPTSNPPLIVTSSPHLFHTTRRMTDLNLTIRPQSRVRLRLGYSRNVNDGPSLSTYRSPETLVFQDWMTTLNSYRIGVDFKVLPRTSFSFDQSLQYYKGDTSWKLNSLPNSLPTGQPIDLGIVFNTAAGQPCPAPLTNIGACGYFTGFSRSAPLRNSFPTSQISFQSNYFSRLDFAGRAAYTGAQSVVSTLNEVFQGFASRTGQRSYLDAGPAAAKRISFSGDLAATFHVNEKLRLSSTWRGSVFRIPGHWYGTQTSGFGTPTVHTTGSGADFTTQLFSNFLGQTFSQEDLDATYTFNKYFSARLGYRYNYRRIDLRAVTVLTQLYLSPIPARGSCAGRTVSGDSCTASGVPLNDEEDVTINQHTGLLGLSVRPNDKLRMNFDTEIMTADNVFTRISPRQLQHYRFRSRWQPSPWLNVNGSFNILENRNNTAEAGNLQHNRSYAVNTAIAKSTRWGLDVGYQYTDIFSRTNICFTSTPFITGANVCPVLAALVTGLSFYNNTSSYGYFHLMLQPTTRVGAMLGYEAVGVDGTTLILNPLAPAGPLNSIYHRPAASLNVGLTKGLAFKSSWGYYAYTEGTVPDVTGISRGFRAHLLTLSLRYGF